MITKGSRGCDADFLLRLAPPLFDLEQPFPGTPLNSPFPSLFGVFASLSSFPETRRNPSKKARGEIEGNMESDQESTCPLLLGSSTGGTSSSKEKAADLVDRRALANGTRYFAQFFATSSVGEEAGKFAVAAADFSVAEDEHAKKTAAAALSASATALSDAVRRAGEVDSALASYALRLLGDARKLLPQDDDDDDDSQAGRCFSAFLARLLRRSKTTPTLIQDDQDTPEEPRLPLHERDVERQKVLMDKRNALYCLSMPASLTLLPTLPDKVPKDQHTVAAFIYGCIFSSATVGLVLSLHALDRIDLEIARFLCRLSVVGLAVLVVFYVSYALAPGNSWMLWFFMLVVFCGHAYAWINSCRFKLDKPVPIPAEQPDGGD